MPAEAASLARLYAKVLEPRRASSTFEQVLAKFRGVIYADRPVSKLGCSTVVVQLLPNKPIAPIAARTRGSISDVIY